MNFLDLFAGIGGFRMGMETAGHKAVGWCEWDKFARKSYEAIHNTKGEWTWGDISTIDYRELPRADIWTFGFPCQDISVAGKQEGFTGNRSSLFFAVTKRLRQIKEWDQKRLPTYLFIENVKNFLSVNNGWDFLATQIELDEIGYDVEWDVLNSKDFGVPQNRERVFIIGHLRGRSTRKIFPITGANEPSGLPIKIIAHRKGYRRNTQVFDPNGITESMDTGQGGGRGHYTVQPILTPDQKKEPKLIGGIGEKNFGKQYRQGNRVYDAEAVSMCFNAQPIGNTGGNSYLYKVEQRIRKLTPKECFRLQGFPDWAFEKASEVNSDSQLYKQAGNSVTVNVISEIAKRFETS